MKKWVIFLYLASTLVSTLVFGIISQSKNANLDILTNNYITESSASISSIENYSSSQKNEPKKASSSIIESKVNNKTALITCGYFTIRYNPSVHQVGLSFDENKLEGYIFDSEEEKKFFIERNKDYDPCLSGGGTYELPIYSLGKRLRCNKCDGGWTPDISLKINQEFFEGSSRKILEESMIINQQPINIPSVKNARIVTYKPYIYINQEHIVKDLNFEYNGNDYLFGINLKDGEIGNHKSRSSYDPNSNYDELLLDAISALEVRPIPKIVAEDLPYKKGGKTCEDFTLNFDANKIQVGFLDGQSELYDGITGVKKNPSDYLKNDLDFLEYTQNSRTCGKEKLNLYLYPKGTKLNCFRCDGNGQPSITLFESEPDYENAKDIISEQKITKPNIQNAKFKELAGDGRGLNPIHNFQFEFEHKSKKYILASGDNFTLEDSTKEEIAKYKQNLEKLIEDLEVSGESGKIIWGEKIAQVRSYKCGDFSIDYDPAKYQVGQGFNTDLMKGKNYNELNYMSYSEYINKTKLCNKSFGGVYLVGSKQSCWGCDSLAIPSIVLEEAPEPKNEIADNGSGFVQKVLDVKNLKKSGLENVKIIDYQYESYSRRKESLNAFSFDYKGKHYLLKLQESWRDSKSDFNSSEEYNSQFNNLINSFKVN
jgi:hypothetical protein